MKFLILGLLVILMTSNAAEAQKRRKKHKNKKAESEILVATSKVAETAVAPKEGVFIEEASYCSDRFFQEYLQEALLDPSDVDYTALEQMPPPKKPEPTPEELCEDPQSVEIFVKDDTITIDRKWLDSEEYFALWDTRNVDPYPYKVTDFEKDSIPIKLFQDSLWAAPLKGTEINSKYGMRRWRWHHGTDLDLEVGDSIYASFNGIVRIAKYNRGGYGYYVMLRHENGLETLYGHLSKMLVDVGQEVKAGELIALGGNTGRSSGPHLHYEMRYRGYAFNPVHLYDFEEEKLLCQEFVLNAEHYAGLIEQSKSLYHKIRSGDSLWVLSRRYHTSISTLCRLNNISRKTTLRIGRRLRVR